MNSGTFRAQGLAATTFVLLCLTFTDSMAQEPTYVIPPVLEPNPAFEENRSGFILVDTPLTMTGTIGFIQPGGGYNPYSGWGSPFTGTIWQGIGTGYSVFGQGFHAWKFWIAGGEGGVQSLGLVPVRNGSPGQPVSTLYDNRTPSERADAPKLEFDKMSVQPMKDRCWKATVSGRVNDLGPPDPNGLKLSYDSGSGGRQTINVAIGADGSFNDSFEVCPMGDIENVRPLLMYGRSPGDNVNVGYSGSALRFERRREVLELRESIQLRVKGMGHFRVRVPAAVMGVRG